MQTAGNGEDWTGEGDQAEWRALQVDKLVRPLKRQLPQKRGPDQPRTRSRSLSVTAKAKQMKLWSIKSTTNASCRDGVLDLFCAMERKHGKAQNWPVDAELLTGEGENFWKQVRDKDWTQDHIPSWCLDAIEARARATGGPTKPPTERLLPSVQLKVKTKRTRRGRPDVLVILLYWFRVYR